METGIYFITAPNGKRYIGSAAISFRVRWNLHRCHLRRGDHHSIHLQRAWNKYGEENMVFSVYLQCEPHECLELEQIAIDVMHPEYNVARNVTKSFLGCKHTAETLAKMSLAQKSRPPRQPVSDATREACRRSSTGRRHTEATKEKCRLISLGVVRGALTPEHSAAVSAGLLRYYSENPSANIGREVLPEVRAASSARWKARTGPKNPASRPVKCIETQTVFETSAAAMNWLREIGATDSKHTYGCIGKCCRGVKKYKSAYGYHWRYADQPTVDNPATAP